MGNICEKLSGKRDIKNPLEQNTIQTPLYIIPDISHNISFGIPLNNQSNNLNINIQEQIQPSIIYHSSENNKSFTDGLATGILINELLD